MEVHDAVIAPPNLEYNESDLIVSSDVAVRLRNACESGIFDDECPTRLLLTGKSGNLQQQQPLII